MPSASRPAFYPPCPSICSHQCPAHADFPPDTASNSPSPTNESVNNAHSDASPAYMERGEEYILCHLTRIRVHNLAIVAKNSDICAKILHFPSFFFLF
jgi:hypothetical protein